MMNIIKEQHAYEVIANECSEETKEYLKNTLIQRSNSKWVRMVRYNFVIFLRDKVLEIIPHYHGYVLLLDTVQA